MKKVVSFVLASVMALALVGCGSTSSSTAESVASSAAESVAESVASSAADSAASVDAAPMADGIYTAQMDDASAEAAYGWRDQLVVEYKDGQIVSAVFESYDADGNKKSETTAETYPMDPSPAEWIPQLSANITEAGADFDAITGATLATNNARAMLEAIAVSGKPGETIVVAAPADAE